MRCEPLHCHVKTQMHERMIKSINESPFCLTKHGVGGRGLLPSVYSFIKHCHTMSSCQTPEGVQPVRSQSNRSDYNPDHSRVRPYWRKQLYYETHWVCAFKERALEIPDSPSCDGTRPRRCAARGATWRPPWLGAPPWLLLNAQISTVVRDVNRAHTHNKGAWWGSSCAERRAHTHMHADTHKKDTHKINNTTEPERILFSLPQVRLRSGDDVTPRWLQHPHERRLSRDANI